MMAHGAMRPMKEDSVEKANQYHDMGVKGKAGKVGDKASCCNHDPASGRTVRL